MLVGVTELIVVEGGSVASVVDRISPSSVICCGSPSVDIPFIESILFLFAVDVFRRALCAVVEPMIDELE